MSLQEITFHTEQIENVYIVSVQGAVDFYTSRQFLGTIEEIFRKGPVILDMDGIHTVSSSGIDTFKHLREMALENNRKIIIMHMRKAVEHVFNSGGIKYLFLVAENEDEAMRIATAK